MLSHPAARSAVASVKRLKLLSSTPKAQKQHCNFKLAGTCAVDLAVAPARPAGDGWQ